MKLIEATRTNLIECDTEGCGFIIPSKTGDIHEESHMYIQKKCPNCGEVLLTLDDALRDLKAVAAIDWVNKWFGWLGYFKFLGRGEKATLSTHGKIEIKTGKL